MSYENKPMPIKSWAEEDRPREKLLRKGKSVLSDAELLAIIIGSGSKNVSAVSLSKIILASIDNNLNRLGKMSVSDLKKFKGIGEAKAITIITTLELGRRRRLEEATEFKKITSSKAVYNLMQPLIGELQHEEFWIVYLNNSNKIVHKEQLSKGGLTGTLVDGRLVFKKAIELYATAIILCHNHPSGKLQPSAANRSITKKLIQAGNTLDIKVLDHVIITEKAYFSFADENLL